MLCSQDRQVALRCSVGFMAHAEPQGTEATKCHTHNLWDNDLPSSGEFADAIGFETILWKCLCELCFCESLLANDLCQVLVHIFPSEDKQQKA